jgi:predicted lipoprotein with Yx(FWY)xxD motif
VTKVPTLPLVPVLALAIAACGSSNKTTSTPASPPASTTTAPPAATTPTTTPKTPATTTRTSAPTNGPKISAATVGPLGPVLVNAHGRTLYIFVPDNDKKVTCLGGCAAIWPAGLRAERTEAGRLGAGQAIAAG